MTGATPTVNNLYRTIWRWHFYAGLFVAPFIVFLALTGSIYLFKDEINDALYTAQRFVSKSSTTLPAGDLVNAALSAYPGSTPTRIDLDADPRRSAVVFLTSTEGQAFRVYVDPGSGRVLGDFVYEKTLVGFSDVAHGTLMLGDFGDRIVELAACWAIVLSFTGLYLWWPRGRRMVEGVILPSITSRGRLFVRDLHASVGLWTAGLILFLLFTGLPWAGVWGPYLKQAMDVAGIGRPVDHEQHVQAAATTMKQALGDVAWTMEQTPMPRSTGLAEHSGHASTAPSADARPVAISINHAAEIVAANGLEGSYRLFLPSDAAGVYSAATYPDKPEGQRTLQIDQYSGAVLRDVSFGDYGWGAKAVELGIQIHMGNYFGPLNQAIMLLACLGAITLAVTGPIMWWRRRPKGSFGVPRVPEPARLRTFVALVVVLAVVLPLAGASLLVVILLDRALAYFSPRLAA